MEKVRVCKKCNALLDLVNCRKVKQSHFSKTKQKTVFYYSFYSYCKQCVNKEYRTKYKPKPTINKLVKFCKKCNNSYPRTKEFFKERTETFVRQDGNITYTTYFKSTCKKCLIKIETIKRKIRPVSDSKLMELIKLKSSDYPKELIELRRITYDINKLIRNPHDT